MAGNRSVLERPSWTLSVWVRPRRDRISLASAEPGTISRRTLNRRGMESSTGLQLGDCNDVLSSITSSGPPGDGTRGVPPARHCCGRPGGTWERRNSRATQDSSDCPRVDPGSETRWGPLLLVSLVYCLGPLAGPGPLLLRPHPAGTLEGPAFLVTGDS